MWFKKNGYLRSVRRHCAVRRIDGNDMWTGAPPVSGSRGGFFLAFKRKRCFPLALFAAERVERMEARCSSCWNVAGCERDQENQDCGQDKCQPIAETQTIN